MLMQDKFQSDPMQEDGKMFWELIVLVDVNNSKYSK